MDQAATIDAITASLDSASGLDALLLTGSFGRGTADAESDIDLTALVAMDDQPAFAATWRTTIEGIMPVVHWAERPTPVGRLINAIGADWLRIDLSIIVPATVHMTAQDLCRPLIDPTGVHATLRPHLPVPAPDPAKVARLITEFIRVLGLLPVVVTRHEYVVAAAGVGLLRQMLIDLMREEVPVADRGGALHLGRLLDSGDVALLEALPYPGPDRDAIIAAHLALAETFLPRARALALRLGLAWPGAFEEATWRHLSAALGIARSA